MTTNNKKLKYILQQVFMKKRILFAAVFGAYIAYLVGGFFASIFAFNLKKKTDLFAEYCLSFPINYNQCSIFFNKDIKSMSDNELESMITVIGKDNIQKTYEELHSFICKSSEQEKCKLEPLRSLEMRNQQ